MVAPAALSEGAGSGAGGGSVRSRRVKAKRVASSAKLSSKFLRKVSVSSEF